MSPLGRVVFLGFFYQNKWNKVKGVGLQALRWMPWHRYWGPWFPEMGFFCLCLSVSVVRGESQTHHNITVWGTCSQEPVLWPVREEEPRTEEFTELLRISKAFSLRFLLFVSNLGILKEVFSFFYLTCSFSFCIALGYEVLALWYYIAEPLCEEYTALRGCSYLWGKPQMLPSSVVIFFHVQFCLSYIFITSHVRR